MDARAGGSDERKSSSATANEAGTQGRHGARQGQGEHYGGRQEKVGSEPLGVGGNKGGREASGVDLDSHGVGGGGGLARGLRSGGKPRDGGRHGVGGGVELPHGAGTSRVAEGPRGDETPGYPTASQNRRGEDGQGWGGGDENPPTARATRR